MRRALYTDSDVSVVAFQRPVMLTSIDPGALRGDLAERLLRLELQRIEGSGRRTEAQLRTTFEGLRPALLGSLLDLLAQVLAALPAVDVVDPPRMADFAYVVAALDDVLGTRTLDVYRTRSRQTVADVIESDPVAATLRRVLEAKRQWEGTPDALLIRLKSSVGQETPRGWPTNAATLGKRLKNLAPALREIGIECETTRSRDGRRYTIRLLEAETATDGELWVAMTLFSRSCVSRRAGVWWLRLRWGR